MSDKVRSSIKAESKRASPLKKIESISLDSSIKDVDRFLEDNYGYRIWNFIYSLHSISTMYMKHTTGNKQLDSLKAKKKKLESAKTKLMENIDDFLSDTDLWEILRKNYPDKYSRWTVGNKEIFITKYFNIERFFKTVDEYMAWIENRIKYYEIYNKIPTDRLRINPRNLAILIWSNVMLKKSDKEDIDFENISILLNWCSINKNWSEFFKKKNILSHKTPELTYNKFIKFAKNEAYLNLSNYLYITCFPDIADPLMNIFPDPFDLIKHEIESDKILAKRQLEKTLKGQFSDSNKK